MKVMLDWDQFCKALIKVPVNITTYNLYSIFSIHTL